MYYPKNLIPIHGMGRLRWSMSHWGCLVKKNNYIVYNFQYYSRNGSIDYHSESLIDFLYAKKIDFNLETHFICHSLGSLILSLAQTKERWPLKKVKAVFLGPPLKGAKIAKIAAKIPGIKSYFGRPLIELTNWKPIEPNKISCGVIAGVLSHKYSLNPFLPEPNDSLVMVSETKISGILDHHVVVCPHAIMMYHPKIIKLTLNFLDKDSFF